MSRRVLSFALIVAAFAGRALAGTLLPEPFSVTLAPEVRSGYQSRGAIIEDRPVAVLPVYLNAKTPGFGTFGLWARDLSSLTARRKAVKSQFDYERDIAIRWQYDLSLSDDISLRTRFDKVWQTFHHYKAPYRGRSDNTLSEWRLRQELKNPVVTPFWMMRRFTAPTDMAYFQVGALRSFKPHADLTFTPQAYVELANRRLMRARYGKRLDGNGWRGGIQALNLRVDAAWRLTDQLALTASVHQFVTINEPARRAVKARSTAWSRRDLTLFTVGLKMSF